MTTTQDYTNPAIKPALAGIASVGLAAFAPLAAAHHPMGGQTPETFTQGLLSGLGHPILGIDHFAFLVVIAVLSVTLAGRARYLVPLAFVGATVAGTLYHLGAADLPLTETVIALSVFLGGLSILLKGSASALLMAVLFGAAGVFHGYAYGEAIIGAETSPLLSYLFGFSIMQYAIIVGIRKAMEALAARSEKLHGLAARLGGISATVIGALFLGFSLT
jgi:urease accessory protein